MLQTETRLTALFQKKHGQGCTRNIKTFRILMKQEMMAWLWHHLDIMQKLQITASHSRQITTPAPQNAIFYRPIALPNTQPTVTKH